MAMICVALFAGLILGQLFWQGFLQLADIDLERELRGYLHFGATVIRNNRFDYEMILRSGSKCRIVMRRVSIRFEKQPG